MTGLVDGLCSWLGIAGQIVGLVALGAAFYFKQLSGSIGDIAVGSLVVYVACFAFGLGPIFWLLISEIYPLNVRGAAMSVATVANWGMNLVVAVTFLTLVDAVGHATTFLDLRFDHRGRMAFCVQAGTRNQGKDA